VLNVTAPNVGVLNELMDQAVQDGYIVAEDGGCFALTERGKRRAFLLSEALEIANEPYMDPVAHAISLVAYGRPDFVR